MGLVPCTQRPGTLLLLLDRYICSSSFLMWCMLDTEDIEGNYASAQSSEPVSGEVRSRQTDARPFCRALLLGFSGLGFLGFLVAKQPLPKRGLRLGPGGLPESVLMPP